MCALTSKIRRAQLNILPQTPLLESVLKARVGEGITRYWRTFGVLV